MAAPVQFYVPEVESIAVKVISETTNTNNEGLEKRLINKVVAFKLILVLLHLLLQLIMLMAFGLETFNIFMGHDHWKLWYIGIVLTSQLCTSRDTGSKFRSSIFICLHLIIFWIMLHKMILEYGGGFVIAQSTAIDTISKYTLLGTWILLFLANIYISLMSLVIVLCFGGMMFQNFITQIRKPKSVYCGSLSSKGIEIKL